MITELRAENFKSWKDTSKLRFAPITGFFGANSSGKTSILQVLLMLKQTVDRPSEWNEPLYFGDDESLVNLGNFDDIIHRPANNPNLGISLSWKPIEPVSYHSVSFSTSIADDYGSPNLTQFGYVTPTLRRRLEWTSQGYKYDSFNGSISADLFRCYGVLRPSGPLEEFEFLSSAFENLFAQIAYLGPVRENPLHEYTWEGDHPKNIGQRGEKTIPAMLSSRVRLLPIEKQILDWLKRLDLIFSYDLRPISGTERNYEFLVQKYKDGPKVRLSDVGFGISQVLPVLAHCYHPPEGSILILEQPEAHLHPKVESELADVLIDVVKNRNFQIILESHSEHLIHRLTRRVAENELSKDDMALYSCQIHEGVSKIEPLEMDVYGNISNWPQNFFGDEMGDLAAKAKAEIKRRKEKES